MDCRQPWSEPAQDTDCAHFEVTRTEITSPRPLAIPVLSLQHHSWFQPFHLFLSLLTGARVAIEAHHYYQRSVRGEGPQRCQAALTFAAGVVLCLNSVLKCATQWCQVAVFRRATFRKRALMLTLFARWQGGASFASFTCGAVLEGLQCDFLLLAYWTQLMALNDEGRYNGRQLLHILSHSVYPILQTMLTSLWFGSR